MNERPKKRIKTMIVKEEAAWVKKECRKFIVQKVVDVSVSRRAPTET